MNAKDAIRYCLDLNMSVFKMFLADFSDSELLLRTTPGANHTAWQIGHLISSEVGLLTAIGVHGHDLLPAGFREKHANGNANSDNPADFLKKNEYLALFDKVRAATIAALEKLSDADLDNPNEGQMKSLAPKSGDLFQLVGNHQMMHAGQFSVLRRKLGKPVLF